MLGLIVALAAAPIGGALYRLRGGWLKTLTGIGSTQICRAVWAVPTAALLFWQAGGPWWVVPALAVSVFLSLALFGHGAHMIYGAAYWKVFGAQPDPKRQTELLTTWWLERVFDGLPGEIDWDQARVDMFNMVGMSAIGLVRNVLAVAPLAVVAPVPAALYAATGLAHGPLYWLGWKVSAPGIGAAEVFVGALSWVSIVLLFGRLS